MSGSNDLGNLQFIRTSHRMRDTSNKEQASVVRTDSLLCLYSLLNVPSSKSQFLATMNNFESTNQIQPKALATAGRV